MTTETRDRRLLPALVAIVVAAFLVIPMVTSAPLVRAQSQEQEDPCDGVPRSTFEDRDEADEVHRPSIDCVDRYDISSGDETGRFFRPNRLVDRAQMATFIVNTLEAAGLGDRIPDGDPPDEFDDIADSTHRENINRLARIGVVQGNNGQYNPDADIKRDQMATFLLQAKEWAYQTEYEPSNSYFGDVRPTNPHFDNINAAYEEELVRGKTEPEADVPNSGTYEPAENVRRQNMASFLSNLLDQVWEAPEQFCAPPSPSPTSSRTATASPRPTSSSTASPAASPTGTASPDSTASPGASPSGTASPTRSPATTSPSPSSSPCVTPSGSASPTGSPSPRPSGSASPTASASPSEGEEECPFPIDPLGFCPEPSPSGSASPTTSPSPTRSATAAAVPVPLDL